MEVLFSKIEQYRPKCNDLMVVGEKIQSQEEMLNDANQSLKDNASKEFHDLSTDEQVIGEFSSAKMPTTPKICFEINETMVSEYNDLANSVLKIRLIFECTRNQKTPGVKYIKFKNRGLATVRFYWNRVEKFLLFRDIIKCDRDESHTFYFNKNELLLPPAETLDFPIWFKSNNIGNYLEMWEITTKPKMWDTDFKLIVNLQGYVYPYGFDEKSKYITEILDKRIAKTAIRGVLNDILQHLKFAESEANSFAFTDRQLFESLNQELWGIEKRPKYMYDKNAVGKLILLYEEMKLSHTSDYWNYSIKELRMMARKKDIWIYVQNETNKMLREKQKRIELNAYTKKNTKNSMQTIELVPPLEGKFYNIT